MNLRKLNIAIWITLAVYAVFFGIAVSVDERPLVVGLFCLASVGGAITMYFVSRLIIKVPQLFSNNKDTL